MNRTTIQHGLACAALILAASAAHAQVDVSVDLPFGRIDLGGYPPPETIYAQPVVVQQDPRYFQAAPLYLHVPPDQASHWRRYCRQYDACGQRVFFVRDDWYQRIYAPRYREVHRPGYDRRGPDYDRRGHGDDRGRGPEGDRGRDRGPGDDRDRDHDHRGDHG